jgi:CubicO group peptidase (beta-lactamase class C family)
VLSRRAFTGGALSLALGSQWSAPAFAQSRPELSAAIAAIRAYAEAHRRFFLLPGLTLGLTTPDGFSTVLDFGYANTEAHLPIGDETLFQIGSITKSMTAFVIHQLAAEGRLSLQRRVSDILPIVPLPRGNAVTVQHLLDHVAGLADSPPLFGKLGLWTAYAPGTHWHYSNSGYDLLGKIAEHVAGKPLARLFHERIFAPLGMTRSKGAIVGADRSLYAQGYEAADQAAAYARGVPLAPAAWVDVTFGAGSVASTSADMIRFMRALADAAQGRAALGLTAERAKLFAAHAVPSDAPGMSYGNGLMHVGHAGRAYLHHTGGMVSFSSSFHVDVASGVGAFASSNLSAFAEYRPRQLTRFAVDALTNALAGRPLPSTPPLDVPLPNAASYVGGYVGPGGAFEVRAGGPLTIVTRQGEAPLQPWGGDIFRTLHPQFRQFSLMFERTRGAITGASWGPSSFARQGSGRVLPTANAQLAKLAGRYVNDDPWFGTAMVVERGGRLWIGTETPMTSIGQNLWRIGQDSWSPERASFADLIDGRPQTFFYSGVPFLRHDV